MSTPTKQNIRMLYVDDESSFRGLAADFVERSDDQFTVETATSAEEAAKKINDRPPDCVRYVLYPTGRVPNYIVLETVNSS